MTNKLHCLKIISTLIKHLTFTDRVYGVDVVKIVT